MVRHKNRYMVVEINPQQKSESALNLKTLTLHTAVLNKVQQLHGDFGVAAVRLGFTAKYCNENTRIAIIKSRHGPHRLVASVLPCIDKLEDKRIHITTLYTGATIRQCFKFIVHHQQKKVDEICINLKTDEEKNAIKEALLDLQKVMDVN